MIQQAIELLENFKLDKDSHRYPFKWKPSSYIPQLRDSLLQWLYFYNTTHTTFNLNDFCNFIDTLLSENIDLKEITKNFEMLFTVNNKEFESYGLTLERLPKILAYRPDKKSIDFAGCLRQVSNLIKKENNSIIKSKPPLNMALNHRDCKEKIHVNENTVVIPIKDFDPSLFDFKSPELIAKLYARGTDATRELLLMAKGKSDFKLEEDKSRRLKYRRKKLLGKTDISDKEMDQLKKYYVVNSKFNCARHTNSYGPHDCQTGPFDYYSVMQELKHLRGLLKLSDNIGQLPLSPEAVNALRTLSNIELQRLLVRRQFTGIGMHGCEKNKYKKTVWSDYNSNQYPFDGIDDIRYSYMDKKKLKQHLVSLLKEVCKEGSNEETKQKFTQFLFYYLLLADGDQMFVQALRWSDACKPIPVRRLKLRENSLVNNDGVLSNKQDIFLHLCSFADASDIKTLSTLCVATHNHIHASDNLIHQRINKSRDATRNDLMKNQDKADEELVQLLATSPNAKNLWKNTVNAVMKVVMLQYYFYSLNLNRKHFAALKERFGPGQYLPDILSKKNYEGNQKYKFIYGYYSHYNNRNSEGHKMHENISTSSAAKYAKVHLRNLLGFPVEFRSPTSGQDAVSLLQGIDKSAENKAPMLWDLITYLRVKPGEEYDYSSTFHIYRRAFYDNSYELIRQKTQVPEVDRHSDSQWLSMVIKLIKTADLKDQEYWQQSIKFIAATPALFIAVLELIVNKDLKDNEKGRAMVLLNELLLYNPLEQYNTEELRDYRKVADKVLTTLFTRIGLKQTAGVLVNNSRAMDYYRDYLRWLSPHRLFSRVENDYPRHVHRELTQLKKELHEETEKRNTFVSPERA